MRSTLRYGVALLVAGSSFVLASSLTESPYIPLGVAPVYAVAVAITLRPDVRAFSRKKGNRWPAGIFAGVVAFGTGMVARSVSANYDWGGAALGFGLAYFGLVCGIWMAIEADDRGSPVGNAQSITHD